MIIPHTNGENKNPNKNVCSAPAASPILLLGSGMEGKPVTVSRLECEISFLLRHCHSLLECTVHAGRGKSNHSTNGWIGAPLSSRLCVAETNGWCLGWWDCLWDQSQSFQPRRVLSLDFDWSSVAKCSGTIMCWRTIDE